jgi:hypothetical protein
MRATSSSIAAAVPELDIAAGMGTLIKPHRPAAPRNSLRLLIWRPTTLWGNAKLLCAPCASGDSNGFGQAMRWRASRSASSTLSPADLANPDGAC